MGLGTYTGTYTENAGRRRLCRSRVSLDSRRNRWHLHPAEETDGTYMRKKQMAPTSGSTYIRQSRPLVAHHTLRYGSRAPSSVRR